MTQIFTGCRENIMPTRFFAFFSSGIASIFSLILVGCATSPLLKLDKDWYYHFKNQPIKVKYPFTMVGPSAAVVTENTIDFSMGAGNWEVAGQYAVEIAPRYNKHLTNNVFLRNNLDKGMKIYLATDRSPSGYNFKLLKAESTGINGRAAVRAIGIDRKAKVPAVLIATAILFDSRIVIGSLFYPLEKINPKQLEDFTMWPSYNSWLATITETDTNRPKK